MKKSFRLWIAISNVFYKVIQFVLAIALIIVAQIFVVPVFEEKIAGVKMISSNHLRVFVTIAFLVAFVAALIHGMYKTILENKELEYILSLRKTEYYLYVLFQKSSWYYMYMIVITAMTGAFGYEKVLAVVLYTILYLAVTYITYFVACKQIYFGKDICFREKRTRDKVNRTKVVKENAYIELILLGIKERYAFFEIFFCKIAVVFIGVIVGKGGISRNIILTIYCFLALVLILANDAYWKNEKEKIKLFCGIGISHKKYIVVNLISGIIFNLLLLALLFSVFSKNIAVGIVFVCIGIFMQLYWNVIYLYTNLRLPDDSEILVMVLYIFWMIIGLIPIMNIFLLVYVLKKIGSCWQGEMEC
ncbi:MAG: hypothetical protein IJF03_11645 [Lachnospiraceae bacterium]|nr:hypothetical protein [Lachnospiraceae bacterium]